MTRTVKTACPLDCYDACAIIAHVEDDRVVRIEGAPDHPITRGRLCTRGYHLVERTNSTERVTEPHKRVGGNWQPITWDQAYAEIAQRIHQAVEQWGSQAILNSYDYGSSGLLKMASDRFFHMLGGCTETVGSICWAAGLTAQDYDFGRSESHDPQDLAEHARTIVMWGRNTAVTNVHQLPFIRAATDRGAKLIVINPLPTELDGQAHDVIALRPGTDGLLALAVCRELVESRRVDLDFIFKSVSGYDEFCSHLSHHVPREVAAICGIANETIKRLAELYADQGVATILGIGLQRRVHGGNAIRAIDALALISGNIGRPGSGVHYANRHALDYVDWTYLQSAGKPRAARQFARTTQASEILAADPPVQVMFIARTNLVAQLPDTTRTIEALEHVPTVVLIDSFFTATAHHADYFLPATTVFEEEDVMFTTMWSPYVAYAHQAVSPRGQSKPDWMIFRDLARHLHLGPDLEIEPRVEIARAFAPWLPEAEQFAELVSVGYKRLPLPVIAYQNGMFKTASGKAELYSQQAKHDGQAPLASPRWDAKGDENDYPYHLLTVHPRWQENSQAEEAPRVSAVPLVELSVEMARAHGLQTGKDTLIRTKAGSLVCTVRVVPGMRADTVKLAQGWSRHTESVNLLTSADVSDLGVGSAQYDTWCRIEQIADVTGVADSNS